MNDVLRRFQQHFNYMATAHIIHVFPGCQQCRAVALKCLAKGHIHEKYRGSSVAQTRDPLITTQTLYHLATQDPNSDIEISIELLTILLKWYKCIADSTIGSDTNVLLIVPLEGRKPTLALV